MKNSEFLLLLNLKVKCRFHRSPPLFSITRQMYLVHTFIYIFHNIHFNIDCILKFTHTPPKRSVRFTAVENSTRRRVKLTAKKINYCTRSCQFRSALATGDTSLSLADCKPSRFIAGKINDNGAVGNSEMFIRHSDCNYFQILKGSSQENYRWIKNNGVEGTCIDMTSLLNSINTYKLF